MLENNSSNNLSDEGFKQRYQDLLPLVLKEWPQLDKADLEAVQGNLDQAIHYIADKTDHTRTLVRHHLHELWLLAESRATKLRSLQNEGDDLATGEATPPSQTEQLIQELEKRTEHLIKEFKAELLPELEQKARSNLGSTLLMTLGLGFILGLLFGGRRG